MQVTEAQLEAVYLLSRESAINFRKVSFQVLGRVLVVIEVFRKLDYKKPYLGIKEDLGEFDKITQIHPDGHCGVSHSEE